MYFFNYFYTPVCANCPKYRMDLLVSQACNKVSLIKVSSFVRNWLIVTPISLLNSKHLNWLIRICGFVSQVLAAFPWLLFKNICTRHWQKLKEKFSSLCQNTAHTYCHITCCEMVNISNYICTSNNIGKPAYMYAFTAFLPLNINYLKIHLGGCS